MLLSSPIRRASILCRVLLLCASIMSAAPGSFAQAGAPAIPDESAEQAAARHERVAQRRQGVHVICHRGAAEFAHENTLEAYRATFELGADGNEIDIRMTSDGVLVCFHDDMLDSLLYAFGDVSELTWDQLQQAPFRNPGRFGRQCRIPTLVEVFELHRQHGGLLHLDIKQTEIDDEIAELLTAMQLWDHVGYCGLGEKITSDARFKPLRYKVSLYNDHSDVFPDAITAALQQPGDGLLVDDPRAAVVVLGHTLGTVSDQPVPLLPGEEEVARMTSLFDKRRLTMRDFLNRFEDLKPAEDWDRVAQSAEEQAASADAITQRAMTAALCEYHRIKTPHVIDYLTQTVRHRSLHKNWRYHGLDGAMALRALILLDAPGAVDLARETLWRDDPALDAVKNPMWDNPRAWTDFRVKMVIFPTLAKRPGAAAEQLCRDYLALSDEAAKQIAPAQFELAAHALLTISPTQATAEELFGHRLRIVQGRAVLDCVANKQHAWARTALAGFAPYTLDWPTGERKSEE